MTGKSGVAQSMAEEDDDLMEQSIRNEIPGTVKEIISDKMKPRILSVRTVYVLKPLQLRF